MGKLKKTEVTQGVCWVEATEAELFILCGCPEDAVRARIKGKTWSQWRRTRPKTSALKDVPVLSRSEAPSQL